MGRAIARIEKKGIPAFIIVRKGFKGVIFNAFQSMGFPRDAPMFEFPSDMFLPGSSFDPIDQNFDKIVDGLTKWKSTVPLKKKKEVKEPKTMIVEGSDYGDALMKMNAQFMKKNWGDGLPLLPPTADRVDWMLTGTDLPRDTVLGRVLPSGRNATVEACAVSLAMSDGRPEYMPVMIAACKAMLEKGFRLHMMQATTCSSSIGAVVNGPVGKQIRLNSGYSCLGPHPWYPAGGRIGRALRLLEQNIGEAPPELVCMANFGGPQKWTNILFAEDEDGLPEGWDPLCVDRGFEKGSNTITILAIASATNLTSLDVGDAKSVQETLYYYARIMGSDYGNIFTNYSEKSSPGIIVMPRGHAKGMAAAGWTKKKVKEYLWENSKVPMSVVHKDSHLLHRTAETLQQVFPEGEPWPLTYTPEQLMVVVAGGEQSGHGYHMRLGCCCLEPVTMEIELPKNWDELIARAEEELGPVPTVKKSGD